MAIVTPLTESDTFRTWLTRTNTAIDLLNSNTVIAGVNATGTFVVANGTSDTTTTLTIHHATGGQTLANSTGLFISGNTTFSGLNFTANASSNVFTVSSNTTLLESLGGTTINSALVASKTLAVTGNTTLSANLYVTGAATFSANVSVANSFTVSNTVYAKAVLFSETDAVVSAVLSGAGAPVDDYSVTGLSEASVVLINPNTMNVELTGLVAPTNLTVGAKVLYLQNSGGTYKITLKDADTGSTDVNRFVGVTTADVIIPPGGAVTLLYTTAESRWRILGQVEPHVTRTQSIVSGDAVRPNADTDDIVTVTALGESLEVLNPSPVYTVVDGQKLIIRIKDAGIAYSITWGDQYRPVQSALPTTTIANKTLYLGFIYNSTGHETPFWELVANAQEA